MIDIVPIITPTSSVSTATTSTVLDNCSSIIVDSSSSSQSSISSTEMIDSQHDETNWFKFWALLALLFDYVYVMISTPTNSEEITMNKNSADNFRASVNKKRLSVIVSEVYSSLFASRGIESTEDFEKMVNSIDNNTFFHQHHSSVYSQHEDSDDESNSNLNKQESHIYRTFRTKQTNKDGSTHELEQLKSNLTLFKFPIEQKQTNR